MNIEYYNKYLEYEEKGIKSKAKEYINYFINSFENNNEKNNWTIEYLPKLKFKKNGNIRYELLKEIIFPVLLEGYNNKNINYMIWLAKIIKNYSQGKEIDEKLNYISDLSIIKECYKLDPNNIEVIDLYIKIMAREIIYRIHEWPSGILIGNTSIEKDECKILLNEEIPLLRILDRNKIYNELINEYEYNLKNYIIR